MDANQGSGQMHNCGNTGSSPSTPKKSFSWKSLVVGALVLYSVASTGVANWSDNKIEDYYNNFYRLALQEVFNKWNALVDIIKKDNVQDAEVVEYTSKTFIPTISEWTKKGTGLVPPEYAGDAHRNLMKTMAAIVKECQRMQLAITQKNGDQFEQSLKATREKIAFLEKEIAAFKEKLSKERQFTFHEAEK